MNIPGYQIQKKIGQGGMATVYLAIQESLHRPVVLKILDSGRFESEQWAERFLIEGRMIASLHHPNIVTIYDIGLADKQLFISMEYIQGGDLKQRIGEPIEPARCLNYLSKIAGALDAAHHHAIVHRDVKPANILFRDDDTPLLTDFGIAKQIDGDLDLTSTGVFLGSPNYVSPEQANGFPVDARSDIYGMGCILFEMLTGEKPFIGESVVEIIIHHKQSPIPQLPEEHVNLQPLLDRMMAKRKEDRFRDCRTMIEFIKNMQNSVQMADITASEYDLTVAGTIEQPINSTEKEKNYTPLLIGLMTIALTINIIINVSLYFIDKDFKKNDTSYNVPIQSTLNLPNNGHNTAEETPKRQIASPEVKRALLWLGKQSLDEYRLTFPAKDNAHYYFSKLLEIDENNQQAKAGLLNIAERYALLAEETIANGDIEKGKSYIKIGLQIDPNNKSLHTVQQFVEELDTPSFWDTIQNIFSSD